MMSIESAVTKVDNVGELELFASGKVRETFRFTSNVLLMVSTDRISAFDYVLPTGIPGKGKVLNGLSKFFFRESKDVCPNHFISTRLGDFIELEEDMLELLEGRAMLVEEMKPIPFECIVRGHLCGSAWREYQASGKVGDITLPQGLEFGDSLKTPLFTPTTKAETGHDRPVTQEDVVAAIGKKDADYIHKMSIELFDLGHRTAYDKGIAVLDTKFEFGYNRRGEICVMDEFMTPDSSRFWLKSEYRNGQRNNFYDKEYIRSYLNDSGWDKEPPAPNLPDEVVAEMARRYRVVYESITEHSLA
ncbi:phosphoribosylaminoimidazolesuccinocarboxamide synthase [bacterium]|nr:phosphoribosylaminoimidazolesuccinocarboxamide synthase [bacterium]